MGKIRVKTIGDESAEKKQKEEAKKRKEAKRLEEIEAQKRLAADAPKEAETSVSPAPMEEANAGATEQPEQKAEETQEAVKKIEEKKDKKTTDVRHATSGQKHSSKYLSAAMKVNRTKTYSVKEALEILPELHIAKFDETVELHINTTETGVSGNFVLPHGTGKKTRVAIADDAIIAEIEKGNINFDILIAHPSMMPKLARVARILGPKGLMPNPKNGTISPNPEEAAKKYEGGQVNFKTESKNPIIHLSIGKLSFDQKQLLENYQTALAAVGKNRVKSITLKSTMSPGIKIAA